MDKLRILGAPAAMLARPRILATTLAGAAAHPPGTSNAMDKLRILGAPAAMLARPRILATTADGAAARYPKVN
ncbi:hypothetical protein [Candidatus Thalassolituus haligoni]|uniref:hypothetical protein n=1 Tax=Candidatus Thalassolituus haligoni TaxID=3100113 RepID=UPI0035118878